MRHKSSNSSDCSLDAYDSTFTEGLTHWLIDSGCNSHMTFDRSAFDSYYSVPHSSADLGADSRAHIVAQRYVVLQVCVSRFLILLNLHLSQLE